MTLRSDIKIYVALIPAKTYMAQLMRLGVSVLGKNTKMKVFFDRDEAIRWMESLLV
jgi:hypothetical protein